MRLSCGWISVGVNVLPGLAAVGISWFTHNSTAKFSPALCVKSSKHLARLCPVPSLCAFDSYRNGMDQST